MIAHSQTTDSRYILVALIFGRVHWGRQGLAQSGWLAPGTDKAVTTAGIKLNLGQDRDLGGFNNYGWDTYNTTYVEVSWIGPLSRRSEYRVSAQLTDKGGVIRNPWGAPSYNSMMLEISAGRVRSHCVWACPGQAGRIEMIGVGLSI